MSGSSIKSAPILLALALVLSACQWNVGTVEVLLVYTPNTANSPIKDLINTLRVRIEGDDLSPRETEFNISAGKGGVLSDIPLGSHRVLTVEGIDEDGHIRSRGVSAPFDTKSGNTKIYLYFSQVGKFSEPPFSGNTGPDFFEKYTTGMSYPSRVFHTATSLPSGEVLVIGGTLVPSPGGFLVRVDSAFRDMSRFDTTAGAFFNDSDFYDCDHGRMCMNYELGRARHSAELLPGGANVVVAGGEPINTATEWPGEYYSIETRTFGNKVGMGVLRSRHSSAVLTGSRQDVLIAGGAGTAASDLLSSVERFEAGNYKLQLSVVLAEPRTGAATVALPEGMLVIGGWNEAGEASKKVDYIKYDGENLDGVDFDMQQARAEHSAVLLDDPGGESKVFVCGGRSDDGSTLTIANNCELLYPDLGTSELLELTVERWAHTATVLQDGRVLISGGFYTCDTSLQAKGTALLFDTPVGLKRPQSILMVSPRAGHTATLLHNGMVLLIGGIISMAESDGTWISNMASNDQLYEIFNPPL